MAQVFEEDLEPAAPAGSESDGSTPGAGGPQGDQAKRESRLREELRVERAKRLGLQFGLPKEVVEQLESVDRDKQEGFVLQWLADNGGIASQGIPAVNGTGGEGEEAPAGESGAEAPPAGADAMTANPSEAEPAGGKRITPADAAALQRSNPDLWIRFRKSHPYESEQLLRGNTVEGISLTDL